VAIAERRLSPLSDVIFLWLFPMFEILEDSFIGCLFRDTTETVADFSVQAPLPCKTVKATITFLPESLPSHYYQTNAPPLCTQKYIIKSEIHDYNLK
jgi:hypothetical protein